MIWKRDMYLSYMAHQDVGRNMFCELFGPLKQLEDEWRAQGATEAEIRLDAFGFDSVDYAWVPAHTGFRGAAERILEENEQYRIILDGYGRRSKLFYQSATIPLPQEYPVQCEADWEKIKSGYLFCEERVDRAQLARLKKRRDEGTLILAAIPGGFDEPRQLMGEEELCIALYEQPELIEDMLSTMADTALKTLEMTAELCPIDQICVHEDMAGRSGPLLGPNMIGAFIKPYYRKVFDTMKKQGAVIFSQDSDGEMTPVIDAFLDCGINNMYPFEPQAGMDMVKSLKKYGNRLSVKGGIDKFALRKDKNAIRQELEYKICETTLHGGVVFGLDHRIPNGVSLENYKYYVETAKEMLGLEPIHDEPFVRMAF